MVKFTLLGLGFILIFKGLVYFLFVNKLQVIFEILNSNSERLRFFSNLLIVSGSCLIYFTIKIYNIK
jgi:uncharacterized protein YjeT (DUF2065 family)